MRKRELREKRGVTLVYERKSVKMDRERDKQAKHLRFEI